VAIYCSNLFLYLSNTIDRASTVPGKSRFRCEVMIWRVLKCTNMACTKMLAVNMQVGHGWNCIDPWPIWPIQKTDPFDPLTHRPIVYSALQTDNDTNTSSLTICIQNCGQMTVIWRELICAVLGSHDMVSSILGCSPAADPWIVNALCHKLPPTSRHAENIGLNLHKQLLEERVRSLNFSEYKLKRAKLFVQLRLLAL